jgi:hypothetical protein
MRTSEVAESFRITPAASEQYDFQPIRSQIEHGLILIYRIRFNRENARPQNE